MSGVDSVTVQGNTVKIEITLDGPEPDDNDEAPPDEDSSSGPSILGVAGAILSGAAAVVGAAYDAVKPSEDSNKSTSSS